MWARWALAILLIWCELKARHLNQWVLAGVSANKDFDEGDLILKDQVLVGAQHSLNKVCLTCYQNCSDVHSCPHFFYVNCYSMKYYISVLCVLLQIDCVVCSYCFRFIGSIEFQIGHRLYLQSIGSSVGCHRERHCHGSDSGSSTGSPVVTKGDSDKIGRAHV